MELKNIKFMFTSKQIPDVLKNSTLKLHMGLGSDKIRSVFVELLKQNCDKEWDLPPQAFQKIAVNSYDICCKITQ